jgi:hypothetical protein
VREFKVEIPDEAERRRVIELCSPDADAVWVTRLAAVTAGLKAIQIESILRPSEATDDVADRQAFIARLLGPGSEARAAKAVRYLFDRIVPMSRRIKRVYVYNWLSQPENRWDSGLIDHDGHTRKTYDQVKKRSTR